MKIRSTTLIFISYFLIVILSEFLSPSIRKTIYLLPVLGLYYFLKTSSIYVDDVFKISCSLLLIVLISFLWGVYLIDDNHSRMFKEFVFIISPYVLTPFFYRFNNVKEFDTILNTFFISFFLLFLFFNASNVFRFFTNFLEFIITSSSELESTFAYVFGAIPIFYLVMKNKRMFYISLPLAFIGSKRIAIVAMIFSILIYFVQSKVSFNKKYVKIVAVLVNGVIFFSLVNIVHGTWGDSISNYIGLNLNILTKGRLIIWDQLMYDLGSFSWSGAGLSATSIYLRSGGAIRDSNYLLLHSDILRIYIEFGFILASAFFFFLYKFVDISIKSLPLIVYLNVLFLTDNTFIYAHITIFIFILITRVIKD